MKCFGAARGDCIPTVDGAFVLGEEGKSEREVDDALDEQARARGKPRRCEGKTFREERSDSTAGPCAAAFVLREERKCRKDGGIQGRGAVTEQVLGDNAGNVDVHDVSAIALRFLDYGSLRTQSSRCQVSVLTLASSDYGPRLTQSSQCQRSLGQLCELRVTTGEEPGVELFETRWRLGGRRCRRRSVIPERLIAPEGDR
ncbi:hypothetical protein MRX96_041020 [Rhipicephalus microplus]